MRKQPRLPAKTVWHASTLSTVRIKRFFQARLFGSASVEAWLQHVTIDLSFQCHKLKSVSLWIDHAALVDPWKMKKVLHQIKPDLQNWSFDSTTYLIHDSHQTSSVCKRTPKNLLYYGSISALGTQLVQSFATGLKTFLGRPCLSTVIGMHVQSKSKCIELNILVAECRSVTLFWLPAIFKRKT